MSPTLAPIDFESATSYSDFLEQMSEFGFLENLEDQLPPGFSAVYEIGRILAQGGEGLGKQLAPMMTLAPAFDVPDAPAPTDSEAQIIEVPAGEEYEAEYGVEYVGFDEFLERSDILTVHVDLNPSSKKISVSQDRIPDRVH